MGSGKDTSLGRSMCLCEHCGKYSYPEAVAAKKGRCPFCGKGLQDDGWAMPVNLVGGRSALGPELMAKLAEKQREADRRAAAAQGEGESRKSSLLDEAGSSLPQARMYGSDGTEDREPPDFVEMEADAEVMDSIMDDDAEIRAQAAMEVDDDDCDEFGNPIVRKPAGGDDGGGMEKAEDLPDLDDMDGPVDGDPDDPFGEEGVPDGEEDPFGEGGPPDGFDDSPDDFGDERPGAEYEDPDDVSEDPEGVSTLPYDPSGTNMPQEVPPDAPRRPPYSGATDASLRRIAAPLPRSVMRGFNRGPRLDFRRKPAAPGNAPPGAKPHRGLIARLDMVRIEYPQSFDNARAFMR